MIELSIEEFLLSAVSISLLILALLSLAGYLFGGSNEGNFVSKKVLRCSVCGTVYADNREERYPVCPNCNRPNRRGSSKRLG